MPCEREFMRLMATLPRTQQDEQDSSKVERFHMAQKELDQCMKRAVRALSSSGGVQCLIDCANFRCWYHYHTFNRQAFRSMFVAEPTRGAGLFVLGRLPVAFICLLHDNNSIIACQPRV